MEYEAPPPPLPEISLLVDDCGFHGDQVVESLTAKSVFSFSNPSVAEKTLDGDGGIRVIRRRVTSIKEAGESARVVGLGDKVQRRRRRCLLRSQLCEKKKHHRLGTELWRVRSTYHMMWYFCFSLVDNVFGKRYSGS